MRRPGRTCVEITLHAIVLLIGLLFYLGIEDVDLRVQTWESVHFRLMYQEKLIQGSCLRRPPEANDIAGVYAVISGGEKNIRKIEKAIFGARFDLFV